MTALRCKTVLVLLLSVPAARAGLHYSGEEINPLPAQWRGFLLDQRLLRGLAFPVTTKTPATALRIQYAKHLAELEKAAKSKQLTADELADLGALYVRLGNPARAVSLLREAHGRHPRHYRIVSNLGTAWQLQGDLEQAETCLREAVRLAPGNLQRAEEYQLRLVSSRRQQPGRQDLDPLLDVHFVNEKDEYEPGKLAAAQRKKIPSGAVADLQLLALWLPADGRLLWLLAELAAVHGDLRTAASIMDGCVSDFALRCPELKRHRYMVREGLERQAKSGPPTKSEHEGHAGLLRTRSTRPLLDRNSLAALPAIKPEGINALPWSAVTRTSVDRKYRPTFPTYLKELDGRQVTLTGYVQPIGDDPELATFLLIEYPVGCWYCEMPDITAIIQVELASGRTLRFTREPVVVTGKLKLNAKDPEDFLFKVEAARASAAE
jgi:hypothetical protein